MIIKNKSCRMVSNMYMFVNNHTAIANVNILKIILCFTLCHYYIILLYVILLNIIIFGYYNFYLIINIALLFFDI